MKNYKVILINLKKDVDRLMYMDQQLKSLGIEYERLEAVNGKEYIENKLGNEYSEENSIKIYGNRLKMGEVGCALSHKRCYEKLILEKDKNIKYYLILEDDITINKDFKNILDELIYKNEKLHKWDYLQFAYPVMFNSIYSIMKLFLIKFKWQVTIFNNRLSFIHKVKRIPYILFAPFVSLLIDIRMYFLNKNRGIHKFFIRSQALNGGYIINNNSAKELVKLTNKITYPADIITSIYLPKNKDIKCYYYSPQLIMQKGIFVSSIDNFEKRN